VFYGPGRAQCTYIGKANSTSHCECLFSFVFHTGVLSFKALDGSAATIPQEFAQRRSKKAKHAYRKHGDARIGQKTDAHIWRGFRAIHCLHFPAFMGHDLRPATYVPCISLHCRIVTIPSPAVFVRQMFALCYPLPHPKS
jgi:hypothetical protein